MIWAAVHSLCLPAFDCSISNTSELFPTQWVDKWYWYSWMVGRYNFPLSCLANCFKAVVNVTSSVCSLVSYNTHKCVRISMPRHCICCSLSCCGPIIVNTDMLSGVLNCTLVKMPRRHSMLPSLRSVPVYVCLLPWYLETSCVEQSLVTIWSQSTVSMARMLVSARLHVVLYISK